MNNDLQVFAVRGNGYVDLITQIHLFLENLRNLDGILESKDIVCGPANWFTCFFWCRLPPGKKMGEIGYKIKK